MIDGSNMQGTDDAGGHRAELEAAWTDGYAFALRRIREIDREIGTLEALGVLVGEMRDPGDSARKAWRTWRAGR
jgi:hypothetical protein